MTKDVDASKVAMIAASMTEKGEYPVGDSKTLNWLISPGGKGIIILESNNLEDVFQGWLRWIKNYPGIFESYDILPVIDVSKAVKLALKK